MIIDIEENFYIRRNNMLHGEIEKPASLSLACRDKHIVGVALGT